MLRAYENMSSDEFIDQLRAFVIALGLRQSVIDQVDRLANVDDLEDEHAEELRGLENEHEAELARATDEAREDGGDAMKLKIVALLDGWPEDKTISHLIETIEKI